MRRIAFRNILFYKSRNIGILVMVAIFAFVLLVVSIVINSIQIGINSAGERMGADIMVVPKGYEGELVEVLLRSEPSTFYFEEDQRERLEMLSAVEKASSQLYIESLNASCCSLPVQIIGVDFKNDFVVTPWISVGGKKVPQNGEVVIGYLVEAQPGDSIILYGTEFPVTARLAQTGTGFDSSVFMTMETAKSMIGNSEQKALHVAASSPEAVSCYMVDVVQEMDMEEAAAQIETLLPGAKAMISNQLLGNMSGILRIVKILVLLVLILLWIMVATILGVVFHVSIKERKGELGLYRLLGYSKKKIAWLLLNESLLLSIAGSACGIFCGCIVVFPFKNLIAASIELPYKSLSLEAILWYIFFCMFLAIATGCLSSLLAFGKIKRIETILLVKEEL